MGGDIPELCGRRPKIVAQEITNMPQSQLASLFRACGFVPSRPLAELQDEWALTIEPMEHFESKMGQLPISTFGLLKLPRPVLEELLKISNGEIFRADAGFSVFSIL